jgi:peroxiredoxin
MSNSGLNPLGDHTGERESRSVDPVRLPASAEIRRPPVVTLLITSGAMQRTAPSSTNGAARGTIRIRKLPRLATGPSAFESDSDGVRAHDQRPAQLSHLIRVVIPVLPGCMLGSPADDDYTRGWTVFYFYVGELTHERPGNPNEDIALHSAYSHHYLDLTAMRVSVAGISTEPAEVQQTRRAKCAIPHDLLSDPELSLASALRLPTGEIDGYPVYEPLALVMRDGVIQRAFYPIGDERRHVGEVVAWIQRSDNQSYMK